MTSDLDECHICDTDKKFEYLQELSPATNMDECRLTDRDKDFKHLITPVEISQLGVVLLLFFFYLVITLDMVMIS